MHVIKLSVFITAACILHIATTSPLSTKFESYQEAQELLATLEELIGTSASDNATKIEKLGKDFKHFAQESLKQNKDIFMRVAEDFAVGIADAIEKAKSVKLDVTECLGRTYQNIALARDVKVYDLDNYNRKITNLAMNDVEGTLLDFLLIKEVPGDLKEDLKHCVKDGDLESCVVRVATIIKRYIINYTNMTTSLFTAIEKYLYKYRQLIVTDELEKYEELRLILGIYSEDFQSCIEKLLYSRVK